MRLVRPSGVIVLALSAAACATLTPLPPLPPPARGAPSAVVPSRSRAPDRPIDAGSFPIVASPAGRRPDESDQPVRVALALEQDAASVSGSGAWRLYDATGEHELARAGDGERWTVVARGGVLRATSSTGASTVSFRGPLVARPTAPGTILSFNGRPYRGEILVLAAGSAVSVINRLSVEEYLRGVVPLEIGQDRTPFEAAAVEAQAIAARSYAYTRIDANRPYDLTATVTDQVYGGVDAERPVSDDAVAATRDLVLTYRGRVINAPYSSDAGGMTAAASEVWRTADEPYLVAVSDRIPGTDRFYDQESPDFHWTRTIGGNALAGLVARYLPRYANAPRTVGSVRAVRETGRTKSGRVAGVQFDTDRGSFMVRGNDVRFVLRSPSGALLPSTMFHMEVRTDGAGRVSALVITGTGSGHGVGMDQWGAIGRARAGQSYAAILSTYYPGTTIGRIG